MLMMMSSSEDARELCQIVAALNYDAQNTIVMPESFERPNFNLVCDLLRWFVRIVDDDDDRRVITTTNLTSGPIIHQSQLDDDGLMKSKTDMIEVSEKERLSFLVRMGKFFASQLGIRLNLVNLYRADTSSCGELLKIARIIYKAAEYVTISLVEKSKINVTSDNDSRMVEEGKNIENDQISNALKSRKRTMLELLALIDGQRSLAFKDDEEANDYHVRLNNIDDVDEDNKTMIWMKNVVENKIAYGEDIKEGIDQKQQQVQKSNNNNKKKNELDFDVSDLISNLDKLLTKEVSEFNQERLSVIDRRLELKEISHILKDSLGHFIKGTEELSKLSEGLEGDLVTLDEKLRKKELELEETRERLSDILTAQSPQYQNEFDRLSKEYEQVYELYVSKFRNLMYLQDCIYSNTNDNNDLTTNEERKKSAHDTDDDCQDDDHDIDADGKLVASTNYNYLDDSNKSNSQAALLDDPLASGEPNPADVRGPGSGTVGPAKLLESLLDTTTGASKPISASLTGALAAAAAGMTDSGSGAGAGAAKSGSGTNRFVSGRAGTGLTTETKLLEAGRLNDATADDGNGRLKVATGEFDGLELEGLLNEFVLAESAAATGATGEYRDKLSSSDQDEAEEDGEDDGDDEEDEEDDEESDDEAEPSDE